MTALPELIDGAIAREEWTRFTASPTVKAESDRNGIRRIKQQFMPNLAQRQNDLVIIRVLRRCQR